MDDVISNILNPYCSFQERQELEKQLQVYSQSKDYIHLLLNLLVRNNSFQIRLFSCILLCKHLENNIEDIHNCKSQILEYITDENDFYISRLLLLSLPQQCFTIYTDLFSALTVMSSRKNDSSQIICAILAGQLIVNGDIELIEKNFITFIIIAQYCIQIYNIELLYYGADLLARMIYALGYDFFDRLRGPIDVLLRCYIEIVHQKNPEVIRISIPVCSILQTGLFIEQAPYILHDILHDKPCLQIFYIIDSLISSYTELVDENDIELIFKMVYSYMVQAQRTDALAASELIEKLSIIFPREVNNIFLNIVQTNSDRQCISTLFVLDSVSEHLKNYLYVNEDKIKSLLMTCTRKYNLYIKKLAVHLMGHLGNIFEDNTFLYQLFGFLGINSKSIVKEAVRGICKILITHKLPENMIGHFMEIILGLVDDQESKVSLISALVRNAQFLVNRYSKKLVPILMTDLHDLNIKAESIIALSHLCTYDESDRIDKYIIKESESNHELIQTAVLIAICNRIKTPKPGLAPFIDILKKAQNWILTDNIDFNLMLALKLLFKHTETSYEDFEERIHENALLDNVDIASEAMFAASYIFARQKHKIADFDTIINSAIESNDYYILGSVFKCLYITKEENHRAIEIAIQSITNTNSQYFTKEIFKYLSTQNITADKIIHQYKDLSEYSQPLYINLLRYIFERTRDSNIPNILLKCLELFQNKIEIIYALSSMPIKNQIPESLIVDLLIGEPEDTNAALSYLAALIAAGIDVSNHFTQIVANIGNVRRDANRIFLTLSRLLLNDEVLCFKHPEAVVEAYARVLDQPELEYSALELTDETRKSMACAIRRIINRSDSAYKALVAELNDTGKVGLFRRRSRELYDPSAR